jgi:hypothetical protein
VDYKLKRRRFDLEGQLLQPWNFAYVHYRHLDGWEINKNRIRQDRYLLEVGKELGSTTVPHWQR